MSDNQSNISRRKFLKIFGAGTAAAAATLAGCKNAKTNETTDEYIRQTEPPKGKMTYRTNPKTRERVSLLGYGDYRYFNLMAVKLAERINDVRL